MTDNPISLASLMTPSKTVTVNFSGIQRYDSRSLLLSSRRVSKTT